MRLYEFHKFEVEANRQRFRVHYEVRENGMLRSEYLPEDGDGPNGGWFSTEGEAWDYARRLARVAGTKYVNIFVVGKDFVPLPGYRERMLRIYPLYTQG